jgi:putative tricarboxylic transport membrane protein
MAKRGRAGPARAIAAIGSFVGGTLATAGLVGLAMPLSRVALAIGPPEFFALMVIGLSLVTGLASRSLLLALISAILGLLITQVGIDPVMGAPRFTFGQMALLDGVGIVPVVMGLFGIGEILLNVEAKSREVFATGAGSLVLSKKEFRAWARSCRPTFRMPSKGGCPGRRSASAPA